MQASRVVLALMLAAFAIFSSVAALEARRNGRDTSNTNTSSRYEENEIDYDDRIRVGEPYKSLLQTTARFALAQSKISNHVNIDTAMNLLNDAGFLLSKPMVLFKVVKIFAVTVASVLATGLLFPGAFKFMDSVYRDPVNTLNLDRYFSNGMSERSVLAVLGTKTDDMLSRVGLRDSSCRERSLCYLGEILRCSFPQTADSLTKFASDNFSNSGLKDSVFSKAFITGFVDRNCAALTTSSSPESQNCLGNFLNSVLVAGAAPQARRSSRAT